MIGLFVFKLVCFYYVFTVKIKQSSVFRVAKVFILQKLEAISILFGIIERSDINQGNNEAIFNYLGFAFIFTWAHGRRKITKVKS